MNCRNYTYWPSWCSQCLNKIHTVARFIEILSLFRKVPSKVIKLESKTSWSTNILLNSTILLKVIAYIHEIKVKEFVSRKKSFMEEKKDRRFHGSLKCKGGGKLPKFYIHSTMNTEKELFIAVITHLRREKLAGFWQLACKSSNSQIFSSITT